MNGNIPPIEKCQTGAPQNELNTKCYIISKEQSSTDKTKEYYYCIGCDKCSANNASARVLEHAYNCQTVAQEWPDTFKLVEKELVSRSTQLVLSGEGYKPPAVCRKKRKAAEPDSGRIDELAETTQGKITNSFGPSKLSAQQQSRIDYYLLRFLVCCSVAWAILDNGFFIEFVTAL